MTVSKTLLTRLPISSAENEVRLYAPKSWDELSQEQLRYLLKVMAQNDGQPDVVKTYAIFRFCGFTRIEKRLTVADDQLSYIWECCFKNIDGVFYISSRQVQALTGRLDWLDRPEECSVRLENVAGLTAVDKLLHGVSFFTYLECEKYYQMAVASQEPRFVDELARRLYLNSEGEMASALVLDDGERLGTLMWFQHVKSVMAVHFRHFFRKMEGGTVEKLTFDGQKFLEGMNAQVRALTGGDVTKERQVFETDCWRALTELDQKAREAEEYRIQYNKK